ncbi:MAG: sigma-54 dependent transcriptional regulator [Gammaproteobacteria bacterium]|jgi:two-component system nitrogen regulation response regulator NtrX
MSHGQILVVDDEPDIRDLLRDILEDEGYTVRVAEDARAAQQACRQQRPQLILLDIWMPGMDGLALLREWQGGGGLPAPVIILSGHGTIETAVEATRLGAWDFIEKPISLAKLLVTVERALEANQLVRENVRLRHAQAREIEPQGESEMMQALREQFKRLARHDSWVLISGEPGVGKTTFARYLHSLGRRSKGPMIEVGGATLSRRDSAMELFGAEQGELIQYGLLEQADGGILYISEVMDMDQATQGRLLNALESQRFTRIGGRTPIEVDVQIIAASTHDLETAVREGRFREDLYYHLNVVQIAIPSLRDHAQDIPGLLESYVNYFHEAEGLPIRGFTVEAQNFLRHYAWPGNVRELRNLVQRLLILGSTGDVDLDEVRRLLGATPLPRVEEESPPAIYDMPLREAREQFERDYLRRQLLQAGGSMTRLAEQVGMERTHLYRKLRSLGLDPKECKE